MDSSDLRKHRLARQGIDSSLTDAVNNEAIPPSPIILNSNHELSPQAYIMLNLISSNHSRWKICNFALVRSNRVRSVKAPKGLLYHSSGDLMEFPVGFHSSINSDVSIQIS